MWFDTANPARTVTVATHVGGSPSWPSGDAIDLPGWSEATPEAHEQGASRGAVVTLQDAGGFVTVEARLLSPEEVLAVAAGLQRRPAPLPGWDLTPDGTQWTSFVEGWANSAVGRTVLWPDAELSVGMVGAGFLRAGGFLNASPPPTIDVLDGAPTIVQATEGLVKLVWTVEPGVTALFAIRGTKEEALAIVRGIGPVTPAEWAAYAPNDPFAGSSCGPTILC